MTESQKCSLRLFLLIFVALAVACWALTALPQAAGISTQPGCRNYRAGETHLPNVPACRKAANHAQTVKPAPKPDMAHYLAAVRRCDKAGWPTTLSAPNVTCIALALVFAGEWVAEHQDRYYPTLEAQTVKPAPPTNAVSVEPSEWAVTGVLTDTSIAFTVPKCGWGGHQRDDGQCEILLAAQADYDDFKCTMNPHKQGDPYVVSCTWKPR